MAAGAAGVGQAVERFGFRNAERAAAEVEQRVLPRIIGRPADSRAADHQGRAARAGGGASRRG